jgi:hypothetical protein
MAFAGQVMETSLSVWGVVHDLPYRIFRYRLHPQNGGCMVQGKLFQAHRHPDFDVDHFEVNR